MNSNDEKLFDELSAAGHAHAATQLAAKPQYIAPYIAYLFRKFNESALAASAAAAVAAAAAQTSGADAAPRGTKSNNSRVVADILIACTWIVFGGDPVESLTRLLEAGQLPSTACGQLWQHSSLAYKCHTCEIDVSSAICIACFKAGDHTGHDYSMIRVSGGCCDCGDAEVWRKEGFCRVHKGNASAQDPVGLLPTNVQRNLKIVVDALLVQLRGAFSQVIDDHQRALQADTTSQLELGATGDRAHAAQTVFTSEAVAAAVAAAASAANLGTNASNVLSLADNVELADGDDDADDNSGNDDVDDDDDDDDDDDASNYDDDEWELHTYADSLSPHELVLRAIAVFLQKLCLHGDGFRSIVARSFASVPAIVSSDGGSAVAVASTAAAATSDGSLMPPPPPRVVRHASSAQETLLLDTLMIHDQATPEQARQEVYTLFYHLLVDVDFKRLFLTHFVRHYRQFIDIFRSDLSLCMLTNFSLPLFTITSVVPQMVEKQGLLDLLIDTFSSLLAAGDQSDEASESASRRNRATRDARLLRRSSLRARAGQPLNQLTQTAYDLFNVIAHRRSKMFFIGRAQAELRGKWLGALALLQRLPNENARRLSARRSMFDDDGWLGTWRLELSALYLFPHLLAAYGDASIATDAVVVADTQEALRFLSAFFEHMQFGVQILAPIVSSCASVVGLPTGVSFHLALQRYATVLATLAVRRGTPLMHVVPQRLCRGFWLIVAHLAARIAGLRAQEAVGMWRYNGREVQAQSLMYESIFCHESMFAVDLLTAQSAAALVGADQFAHTCAEAFGVRALLRELVQAPVSAAQQQHASSSSTATVAADGGDDARKQQRHGVRIEDDAASESEPDDETEGEAAAQQESKTFIGGSKHRQERRQRLLEHFLRYLVSVSNEPDPLATDDVAYLERELVHVLAVSDLTYSEVAKRISLRLSRSEHFDKALVRVAEFKLPQGMTSGSYRLRPERWREFDTHFPRWPAKDRAAADERYQQHLRRHGGAIDAAVSPVRLYNVLVPAAGRLLTESRLVWGVALVTLIDALSVATPTAAAESGGTAAAAAAAAPPSSTLASFASDGVLYEALYVLLLAAERAVVDAALESAQQSLNASAAAPGDGVDDEDGKKPLRSMPRSASVPDLHGGERRHSLHAVDPSMLPPLPTHAAQPDEPVTSPEQLFPSAIAFGEAMVYEVELRRIARLAGQLGQLGGAGDAAAPPSRLSLLRCLLMMRESASTTAATRRLVSHCVERVCEAYPAARRVVIEFMAAQKAAKAAAARTADEMSVSSSAKGKVDRKAEARARKLAILEKFAKQRDAFTTDKKPAADARASTVATTTSLSSSQAPASGIATDEVGEATPESVAAAIARFGSAPHVRCALCHEPTSAAHPSPMCAVVLQQHSQVMPLAARQQVIVLAEQYNVDAKPATSNAQVFTATGVTADGDLDGSSWGTSPHPSSLLTSPHSLLSSPMTPNRSNQSAPHSPHEVDIGGGGRRNPFGGGPAVDDAAEGAVAGDCDDDEEIVRANRHMETLMYEGFDGFEFDGDDDDDDDESGGDNSEVIETADVGDEATTTGERTAAMRREELGAMIAAELPRQLMNILTSMVNASVANAVGDGAIGVGAGGGGGGAIADNIPTIIIEEHDDGLDDDGDDGDHHRHHHHHHHHRRGHRDHAHNMEDEVNEQLLSLDTGDIGVIGFYSRATPLLGGLPVAFYPHNSVSGYIVPRVDADNESRDGSDDADGNDAGEDEPTAPSRKRKHDDTGAGGASAASDAPADESATADAEAKRHAAASGDVGEGGDASTGKVTLFREDLEPAMDAAQQDTLEWWRNSALTPNLYALTCGHHVHSDCFDRYFASLLRSHISGEDHEGDELIDLEMLEFVCPVCRRLANALLPLLPRSAAVETAPPVSAARTPAGETALLARLNDESVSLASAAVRKLLTAPVAVEPTVLQREYDNLCEHFMTRIAAAQHFVPQELVRPDATTLGRVPALLVSIVAGVELAARGQVPILRWRSLAARRSCSLGRQLSLVRDVLAFQRQHARFTHAQSRRGLFWWLRLWSCVSGMRVVDGERVLVGDNGDVHAQLLDSMRGGPSPFHESDDGEHVLLPTALAMDPFGWFVRMIALWPTELSVEQASFGTAPPVSRDTVRALLRIAYTLTVVQAVWQCASQDIRCGVVRESVDGFDGFNFGPAWRKRSKTDETEDLGQERALSKPLMMVFRTLMSALGQFIDERLPGEQELFDRFELDNGSDADDDESEVEFGDDVEDDEEEDEEEGGDEEDADDDDDDDDDEGGDNDNDNADDAGDNFEERNDADDVGANDAERFDLPDCRPLHLRVADLCAVFLRKAFTFQTVLDMGEDLGEDAATNDGNDMAEGALDDATLHDASNIDVLCRALQLPLPHEVFDASELESVEIVERNATTVVRSVAGFSATIVEGSLGSSTLLMRAAKRSQAILAHTHAEYNALRAPALDMFESGTIHGRAAKVALQSMARALGSTPSAYEKLRTLLTVARIEQAEGDKPLMALLYKWRRFRLKHLSAVERTSVGEALTCVPFMLYPLPEQYDSLFALSDGVACFGCGSHSQNLALCLLCGALLCSELDCMPVHMRGCGCEKGLFLVLRATTVLILRHGRYCYWGSPYLDDHGEEDIDIKRGRPLRLNKERYNELHRLWVQNAIEHDSRVLGATVREQQDDDFMIL